MFMLQIHHLITLFPFLMLVILLLILLDTNGNVQQQETNNSPPLLDLSSYPNETNVCLHLSLYFCNCIQMAKKQKFVHQETNVDAAVTDTVGTSSDSSMSDDLRKIKKVLTTSDLENNSRLLLKKELARKWVVPFLNKGKVEKDGVKVPVFDVDTQSLRSLVFKTQPSNNSHIFNNTWMKEFVDKRNLKAGDEIRFKWDQDNKRFDFSVLHRRDDN
ncbi:unnamed protein product [Lathyrus sativus]|nr:unnamed protein product [Lathyrus sativus]